MAKYDLKTDIEQVRDEIKELFYNLHKRHSDVIFTGSISTESVRTKDGDLASSINVTISTTHSD